MAGEELDLVLEEKYVIEKYEGDIQTEEFLVERIVMINDVVTEHYVKGVEN